MSHGNRWYFSLFQCKFLLVSFSFTTQSLKVQQPMGYPFSIVKSPSSTHFSRFLGQITQIHVTVTKYMRFTKQQNLFDQSEASSDLFLWALGWDVGRQRQGIGSRINCLFYGKKTRGKEITATNPLEWYIHNNIRTPYGLTSCRFYQLPIMPPWKLTL